MKNTFIACMLGFASIQACSSAKKEKQNYWGGYVPEDPKRTTVGTIAKREKHVNKKRNEYFNSLQHRNYIKNF